MRILIADDDLTSLRILKAVLEKLGHETVCAGDGTKAWRILTEPESPKLAILDWIMPGLDGLEIVQRVREKESTTQPLYLMIHTSRGEKKDIALALESGANDYIIKPFDPDELRARIEVGRRVIELQAVLTERIRELQDALAQIKALQGFLPICAYCKKIRDDQNYWHQVESYISAHSETQFSHSICPDCYRKFIEPELK
jgi:phosphoserine phosphatase RsbU/P